MKYALFLPLVLACNGCGEVEQPEWAETVAAYGIQTKSSAERVDLVNILENVARAKGHHVDAATSAELEQLAEVYRLTINACAWKGKEDDETLACAMDSEDRPGLVYLWFNHGTEPTLNARFHDATVKELRERFGRLPKIPLMPNGALPLSKDLILTGDNYTVSEENLRKYERDAEHLVTN